MLLTEKQRRHKIEMEKHHRGVSKRRLSNSRDKDASSYADRLRELETDNIDDVQIEMNPMAQRNAAATIASAMAGVSEGNLAALQGMDKPPDEITWQALKEQLT